jgi:hypothetical protein
MRPLKSLTFEAIVDLLATTFREVEDSRAADQLAYSLHDTLMSGFALLFFQHPSLSRFQRAMKQKRRRTYTYRIVRQVSLSTESPVRVTYVEVWERHPHGQLLYHNSGITDLDVTADNVAVGVTIGRTRWKIENEQFNVQKNHGYELTHNYGHGQQSLSRVFYLLNLLAYVTHVIIELGDQLYQRCRAQESRRELWAALRTTLNILLVESWSHLLRVYLEEAEASP